LAEFCRRHPLDEKVFIVPSFVTGRQVGENLAREAGSWANLRFVTTAALAAEVLERRGGAGSLRPMTTPAEIALTDRLFRELLAEGRLDYFAEAGPSPGLSRALHRALRELRLDGRTSCDLRPGRFLAEEKGRALARLLERYEQTLEAGGLLDLPGLLGRAASADGPRPLVSAWVLCPADSRLCRLEAALVSAAAGERFVIVPGEAVAGLDRPRQSLSAPAPPDFAGAGRLTWLFDPAGAPPRDNDVGIEIFRALGPSNECREIVRRLYEGNVPFDQAEVLTPPGSAHANIFYLLAARTGLPVTFGGGVAVSFTSPGRLFFGLLDWLEDDFSSDGLCVLIENGDLSLPGPPGEGPLAPRTACRHLRNAMIGWGRDRYVERLAALRDAELADAAVLEDCAERGDGVEDGRSRTAALRAAAEIDALAAAMDRMLAGIPVPDAAGAYDLRDLCRALFGLLEGTGRPASDLDRLARRALLDRLDEFVSESRFPAMFLKEALGLVRTAGASLRVGASPPLPGRLHVAGMGSGGFSGRPVTFVAGLDEASFPGRGLQDPILLDEERAAISGSLPTSADVLRANLFGLAATLASLRGRLVLSYPSFDIVEGRESFPSSVLLQAFRLRRGDPGLDYGALDKALADASGFRPGQGRAFDEVDWWLDRLAAEPGPDGRLTVTANFPDLAAGLAALEARAGDKLTPFDGLVDIDPLRAEVDPFAGDGAVMSATRLELLARCPFAYFLRHVLKVQPSEEVAFDRSRWLDPLQRGTLVHEILCEFMSGIAAEGADIEALRHRPALARIAAERIAAARRRIPPPSEGIFESERRAILETLDIFLAAEETRETKGRPFAFEKEIDGERIEVAGGRSFRLRGFIDRVDRVGPDLYRIIDYKTGSPKPYEDLVYFGRGRTLQPALYAVALEKALARERPGSAPRVVESGYFFPSRRGEGHEIMVGTFDRERLKRLLGEMLDLIAKGYFIAGPDAACGYCDYADVCASGGPGASKEACEANSKVFEAYRKLDEYK
jgi:ATP-dependent helicase/nuclease subunit B